MTLINSWPDFVQQTSNEYQTLSSMIQSGQHYSYLPNFADLLSDIVPEELEQVGLFLLKPDCIMAGKGLLVTEYLVSRGYKLLFWDTLTRVTEQQVEELYRFGLSLTNPRCMIGGWWLFRRVFDFGPTVLLVCHRPSDDHERFYDAIKSWKGPNNPAECRPGQLRFELGASSRATNLIHTADEPLSFLRELSILYSPAAASIIVHDCISKKRRTVDEHPQLLGEMEKQISLITPDTAIDVVKAVTKLRAAVLSHWLGYRTTAVARAEWSPAFVGSSLRRLRQSWASEATHLGKRATYRGLSPERSELLRRLESVQDYSLPDLYSTVERLPADTLSEWEFYLLQSLFNFSSDLAAALTQVDVPGEA